MVKRMNERKKESIKGIHIRTVNYIMIFVSVILYLLLIFVTVHAVKEYKAVVTYTDDYIVCQEKAAQVAEGSNYLTEQIQLYVMTTRPEYVAAYFEEANVTKRRERALEELQQYNLNPDTYRFLETALSHSNKLMEREIYAIKLAALSQGENLQDFPEEVQKMEITLEDQNLNADAMLTKAREMIFDTGYQDAKALINSNIAFFVNDTMDITHQNQQEGFSDLHRTIRWQTVFISILFLLNLVTFTMVIVLIVKPLQLYINCIKEERRLEITGAYEFKYLALTYNDIYEIKASHEALLRHRAEHDPLTGLINRGAFDQMRQILKADSTPLALLIIDVDRFKSVNDHFGHEVGDQILEKVAVAMKDSFRAKDYPARIGGDEFAVILMEITEEVKDTILHKVEKLNAFLMNPDDGLPPVSLSVGGAFSQHGFPDDLYSRADRALYVTKQEGRCGCRFYEEIGE